MNRRRKVAAAIIGGALIAALFLVSPTLAHSKANGVRGWLNGEPNGVSVSVSDFKKDTHCVVGRVHTGGRWRVRVTDCSHDNPTRGYVSSGFISASGTVSGAACIRGHGYNGTYCYYGQVSAAGGQSDRLGP